MGLFERWYQEGAHGGPVFLDGPGKIKLGDYDLAGRCKITGAEAAYRVDTKQIKGKSAARPTYTGLDTSKMVGIEIFVWTVEQKEAIGRMVVDLGPRPSSTGTPVPIKADALADTYITHVVVESVSAWTESGEGWQRKISCRPWLPAERATRAKGGSAKKTPTKPLPRDLRAEDAAKKSNPPPSQQSGAGNP